MRSLTIDVVSDVICPWCFIGTRRLDEALAGLPDVEAVVTFHPFLLDPSTPAEGADLRERLRRKYGGDPEKLFARVEEAARAAGIPLDFSKIQRTPHTVAAHTLLRLALEKSGPKTQHALARALFEAYFLQGLDIGRFDVLATLAERHGLDADEARAFLADENELAATRQQASAMAAQGIGGVPFTVVGKRVAISGAQDPATFRAAIEQALQEANDD